MDSRTGVGPLRVVWLEHAEQVQLYDAQGGEPGGRLCIRWCYRCGGEGADTTCYTCGLWHHDPCLVRCRFECGMDLCVDCEIMHDYDGCEGPFVYWWETDDDDDSDDTQANIETQQGQEDDRVVALLESARELEES